MERKRIIAAFGDVRGFRKWTLRALNSPEIAGDFIEEIYSIFEKFSLESNGYMKYLGDGLLIILEIENAQNSVAIQEFLKDLIKLVGNVESAIKKIWPRPDGFRIRVASGHVWKRSTMKRESRRSLRQPEYIGYAINMAQALLYVYPEINTICHESIIEIIGAKHDRLVFERLQPPEERRFGVDPQDFAGLWSFGINLNNKQSVE